MSRHHARFVVNGTNVSVEDLGSKNGTFVDGKRVAAPAALKPGDRIRIGPFTLVFRVEITPSSTETELTPCCNGAVGRRVCLAASGAP